MKTIRLFYLEDCPYCHFARRAIKELIPMVNYDIADYGMKAGMNDQVWESGLSYNAARSRKAQLEYEMAQNVHVEKSDLTVNDFLYEFIKK